MKKVLILITTLLLLAAQITYAEQKVTVGKYELHYNTFPSTFLSKEVANANQIQRSKSRGIVSVSILDTETEHNTAVEADVTILAKNLLNQKKDITLFKVVEENKAIYYLGTFALNNQEDINFTIEAVPKGAADTKLQVKFNREFFTD
ncbi:MAG: DUF4426 domain-containing protein [Marinicella sp.]|nr:DUF4426 domain-containing protein [Xanthomonadales bacterium]